MFRALPAVLSLLACVGLAVLWSRSDQTTDCIDYTRIAHDRATLLSVYSWRGDIVLEWRSEAATPWNRRFAGWEIRSFPAAHVWTSEYLNSLGQKQNGATRILGFWFVRRAFVDTSNERYNVAANTRIAAAPDLFSIAITAILPALWIFRLIRGRARVGAGRCVQCGYDLRASSGRCPECGALAASGKIA